MDCASEEGEIRRALEPVAGIRLLRFQLGARTLTIDADPKDLHQALEAIRKAGFDPKPLTPTAPHEDAGEGAHDHDHDHGFEVGIRRMGTALGMAIAAEAVSFFAPDLLIWKLAGMVIAAIAIWLAGLDTYTRVSKRCARAGSTSTR